MVSCGEETLRRLEHNNAELTHLRIAGSNLKTVYYANGIFKTTVEGDFSTLGTFIGNNTFLEALEVVLPGTKQGDRTAQLYGLLSLNKEQNKDHVAIKKILRYHTHIDMEPLFE